MGCAGVLDAKPKPLPTEPAPSKKPAPTQTCAACQASNPLAATVCKACGVSLIQYKAADAARAAGASGLGSAKSVLAVLLLAALAAGGWWWGGQAGRSATQAAAPSQVAAPNQAPPADEATTAMPTEAPPPVAAAASQPVAQNLTQADRAALARQRQLLEKRQERDRLAAEERERAEQKTGPTATAPVAAPAAPAPAPAAAPEVTQTVESLCAGSSNVFTRDFCRIAECRKPALAKDPICVKYREMEKARGDARY